MRSDTLNWYFWMKAINIPSKQGLHMKGLFSASACWTPLLGCACAVVHVVLLVKLHNTGIFQGSARKLIVAVLRFHRTCCNEYEPRPYLFVLWPAFSCHSLSLSAQGLNCWSNNKNTTTSFIIFLLLRIFHSLENFSSYYRHLKVPTPCAAKTGFNCSLPSKHIESNF